MSNIIQIKKIFIVIALLVILPTYSAEEISHFKIISDDGKLFNMPITTALQAWLIKADYEKRHETEFQVPINSKVLKVLLQTMKVIHVLESRVTQEELYEFLKNEFKNTDKNQLYMLDASATILVIPLLMKVFSQQPIQQPTYVMMPDSDPDPDPDDDDNNIVYGAISH